LNFTYHPEPYRSITTIKRGESAGEGGNFLLLLPLLEHRRRCRKSPKCTSRSGDDDDDGGVMELGDKFYPVCVALSLAKLRSIYGWKSKERVSGCCCVCNKSYSLNSLSGLIFFIIPHFLAFHLHVCSARKGILPMTKKLWIYNEAV
jgi:hypothetical protein